LLYPNKFGSSAKTSHDLYKVNFGGFEIYWLYLVGFEIL
jgi:hypothetical protein